MYVQSSEEKCWKVNGNDKYFFSTLEFIESNKITIICLMVNNMWVDRGVWVLAVYMYLQIKSGRQKKMFLLINLNVLL